MISCQRSLPNLKYSIKQRCFALKANRKDKHHYVNYQVFQHENVIYNHDVNICDVDDNFEAVCKLKKTDKVDYFMSQGLDYDRCYEYIHIVKYLNRCWKLKCEDDNPQKVKINQLHHISNILRFIYYFINSNV